MGVDSSTPGLIKAGTESAPVVLEPREQPGLYIAKGSPGYYSWDGIVEEAQSGFDWYLVWNDDSESWSLVDMGELPQTEGVDVMNPTGEAIPKERAVAGYVSDYTVQTKVGKNRFNPEKLLTSYYINSGSGNVVPIPDPLWSFSGFIDVSDIPVGSKIALSSDKARAGAGFFNENGESLRYINENTGTFTKESADESQFAFNLSSPTQPNWTWAQLEIGEVATDYEPYAKYVPKTSVEGLSIIEHKVDVFDVREMPSGNILNPDSVTKNALLNKNNGGLIEGVGTSDQYDTSDFMPVKELTNYTAVREDGNTSTVARVTAFYDSYKSFVSAIDENRLLFETPEGAKFAKVSFPNETHALHSTTPDKVAIIEGVGMPFEYFSGDDKFTLVEIKGRQPSDKPDSAVATMSDLRASGIDPSGKAMSYSIANGKLDVFNGSNSLSVWIESNRGFGGNNMFNFSNYTMYGLANSNGDDVAPMHIEGSTLGANHGRPHNVATISGHGLSNADIGTEWVHSNGNKFYPVRIVNANQVGFLSENLGTGSAPSFQTIPTGTITRGSTTLTITSVLSAQLYPSIKNLKIRVLNQDGRALVNAGIAHKVRIIESYEVMSTVDILNNLITNSGDTGLPVYEGDGLARIENVYEINWDLTVNVFNTFEPLMSVSFNDIMVTQAVRLGTGAAYYVPNSNPLNASVDLRKPTVVAWNGNIPSTYVVNSNQPDPSNPPNRVISYLGRTGFMVGYFPDFGVGADLPSFTNRTFEIRNNSGKIYPHPVEGSVVGSPAPVGEVFSTGMYRAYCDLAKTRTGERLSYFTVPYGESIYLFVDYSATVLDRIDVDLPGFEGSQITAIQEVNATVLSQIFTGSIVISAEYVEGETSFAVIKISK